MKRTPLAALTAALFAPLLSAQTLGNSSTIVVTGNPLGRDTLAQPASSLAGDGLLLRRGSTLGDTLDSLPGATGSGFGPNSSRPVIRGLDGDRVRLLDNGGATVDASNLSFDHAVVTDPLVVERVELLRGPAALLYGGNATGGVVNTLDNRIPRSAQPGLAARAETRLGGAAGERAGAVVLDGGAGALAWHADAFGRRTSDLRVPSHQPLEDGQRLDSSTRVRNSAARAEGGALGASWVGSAGHLGLSVDRLDNDYGVTVEPDVLVRLQRQRLALDGAWRLPGGLFDELGVSGSDTRYRHEEVEGSGEVGTTFRSRGRDLRLQARHRALGPWRGVLGVQAERLRFEALGEEAFVPATLTRSQAVFALEEAEWGAWRWQIGARHESVRVSSEGGERFGDAQSRRFEPFNASLGATWRLDPAWALGLNAGHTERAPAYYELYANGVHVATAAYERGDATLGMERSRHAGATLEWRSGAHSLKASVHDTRFARFIALRDSGEVVDGMPEYRFEAVRARLRGLEVEMRWRLQTLPWQLDLTAQADTVRGDDLDHGQPLPRLAPLRAQLGLEASRGAWSLGTRLRAAARQSRVPDGDTATPGHTLVDAWALWRLPVTAADLSAYLKLDNLGNRLAYNAAAVATVRGLSPLPGRALSVGLRLQM
jgi:iron complex outermembrane receptor protein